MHPAAEDNYGMDACSLLCLYSNLPVLGMALSMTSSDRFLSIIISLVSIDIFTPSFKDL